jgi:hypothetical protein
MDTFIQTENEVFELVAELVADVISQQPGVISVRCTDDSIEGSGEVMLKELLIVCDDNRFSDFLRACRTRYGYEYLDGNDVDAPWWAWSPWSKGELARFNVAFPHRSRIRHSYGAPQEYCDVMQTPLQQHPVLSRQLTIDDLEAFTNEIHFVLAPQDISKFAVEMRDMRVEHQCSPELVNQNHNENGQPAFDNKDFELLVELQAGRLFDPITKKFAKPAN